MITRIQKAATKLTQNDMIKLISKCKQFNSKQKQAIYKSIIYYIYELNTEKEFLESVKFLAV